MGEDIKDIVMSIKADLDKHMEVEEVIMKNLTQVLSSIKTDLKTQNEHNAIMINHLQEHFDDKINVCKGSFENLLEEKYSTKAEIEALTQSLLITHTEKRREDIAKASADTERRMQEKIHQVESKAKLLAWAAGTIMGVVTTVIGLIVTVYDKMNTG